MKITFLGTGTSQGVPVIGCKCDTCLSMDYKDKRLRSSLHIQSGETSIVIDIGPDFRQQMLQNRVSHLSALVLTHEHKDHTAGLDDVRSFNFKQKMDMPLYGRESVLRQLEKEYAYIFGKDKYPGVPRVKLVPIDGRSFTINNVDLLPIEVMHHKLPVYGFKVGSFAYITDAKTISSKSKSQLKDLDVLVLNALQHEPHISHLTFDEALLMIKELKPKQAYLTHISHNLGTARDMETRLPENIALAYDGLQINL